MKRRITILFFVLSLLLGLALKQQQWLVQATAPILPPASITVVNTNDSGAGSLRQAIADAVSGDTICFSLSGCPCTITLTSGELVINKNLTITGPGTNQLTISGNNASRVFFINPGAPGATTGPPVTNPVVSLSQLKIANGKATGGNGGFGECGGGGGGAAGMGGALFINGGAVTIADIAFDSNQARGGNGGGRTGIGYCGGGGGGVGGDGTTAGSGVGGNGGSLGGSATSPGIPGNNGGEGAGGGAVSLSSASAGSGGFGGGGGGASGGSAGNGGFGGGGGGRGSSAGASGGNFGGSGARTGGGGAGLGGAIFIRAGSLAVANSSFTNNSASGGTGGNNGQAKGGALFIHTGATVTNGCPNSTFNGNTATDAAGSGADTNDVYGNLTSTSCNTAPTINALSVIRKAGAGESNSQIATVNDAEDAENTLSVTATLATGSGVTISGISIDSSGNVTANVRANCTATTSTFTLQVTDTGTLSASTTLTVNVNANQLPILTYPANPGTVYGTGTTVSPLTGPSDDVGVLNVSKQSITPSDPGGITVNGAGVVTVANTVPAGMYTVTIRATDVCGFTDASFSLGIARAPLTVTVNNAFRNQGVANPPLSGSITGLKNNDVITATYSTTATILSAPGNYPITATLNDPGNRLSNYQVTNTPGTLKVFNSCGISPVPFFATVGVVGGYWNYYQPLSASPPGIYTFSLFAGTLPPGLAIVNSFGQYVLQGTPTTRGVYTFTLLAKNTGSTCEAVHTYTITIQ